MILTNWAMMIWGGTCRLGFKPKPYTVSATWKERLQAGVLSLPRRLGIHNPDQLGHDDLGPAGVAHVGAVTQDLGALPLPGQVDVLVEVVQRQGNVPGAQRRQAHRVHHL